MTERIVRIFGIPMDLGQNRRGVDMGPSALRYANLQEKLPPLGYTPCDEGNVRVSQAEETPEPDELTINAHYLPQVTKVCQATYDAIRTHWKPTEFGLFVGGDHSVSIGTVAAVAQDHEVGVIWVDAHADMNTPETSPSGNIHGMSLAVLLGHGPQALTSIGGPQARIKPENVVLVGLRDVDPTERPLIRETGVTVYTMRHIDEQGLHSVAQNILTQFTHLKRLHVSFDLDSCDPRIAPGVGTPVFGGFRYREAHLLMEMLADSGKVCSMDVVEINPILDHQNRTAEVAVDMILSLLGKQIL